MKISIRTDVQNGKFKRNINQIVDAVKSFEGKDCVFTIDKVTKTRSNPQNAFYWGVVVVLVQQGLKDLGTIMSKDDVHDMLRLRFLKEQILANEEGEFIERIKSTTELSTSSFMDYIAEIQQFSIEYLGVTIPNPNEDLTISFDNN